MGIGRAVGIFILCAVIMGIVCIGLKSEVKKYFKENGSELNNIAYFLIWCLYSICLWGLVMLVWLGIHLIVG